MDRCNLFWGALLLWTGVAAAGCIVREYFPPDQGTDLAGLLEPPSCLKVAEESLGFFASPNGQDSASCGAQATPCATLQQATARAREVGKAYVFPLPGSYRGSVTLAKGVTIVGGWSDIGGTWRRVCPSDPGLVEIVGDAVAVTATDIGGAAGLEAVTITSSVAATQNGRSTYGIFALGASTQLSLRNVVVMAGDGAPGAMGSPPPAAGAPKAAGSCDPSPTASEMAGGPGGNGKGSSSGTFDRGGYHPRDGASGDTGFLGGNGVANSDYETSDSCSSCSLRFPGVGPGMCVLSSPGSATGQPGNPGCGGQGGPGGGGGKGGGSSIALFTVDARVTVFDSHLTAGNGGSGGGSTSGAIGGSPSSGTNGNDTFCFSNCSLVDSFHCGGSSTPLSGGTATDGGKGGQGGQGGGGAGGWSVALVKIGAADVTTTGTELKYGTAGIGGVAPMPGQAGMAIDIYQ